MDEKIGGPYLTAALICEKVLRETDGVLTPVRIIDKFFVNGSTEQMQPVTLTFSILILLKAGDYRGRAAVAVHPTSPTGKELQALTFSIHFEGDNDRGVAIIAPTGLQVDEEGLYWFDVKRDGQLVSRIPLRVVYQQITPLFAGTV